MDVAYLNLPFQLLDTYFVQHISHFLEQNWPLSTRSFDSDELVWFLSPRQHIYEWMFLNALFLALLPLIIPFARKQFSLAYQRALTTTDQLFNTAAAVQQPEPTPDTAVKPSVPWTYRVALPVGLLTLSFIITAHQKYTENAMLYLLQPCHISCLFLCLALLIPRTNRARDLVLNLFFPAQWGAVLALIQPDLRSHQTTLHITNFILEHTLILLVPVYLARIGDYVVLIGARRSITTLAFLAMALYHSVVLAMLGVFSAQNVNYVLSPPPGPLHSLGKAYRLMMFGFAAVLTWAMQYAVFEAALKLAFKIPLPRAWLVNHHHQS